MNIEINNNTLQEEYEKFKKLCPNAKEKVYPDGSKSLIVEKDGEVLFQLDFIKKGQLSERDIFVIKNWRGFNPKNVEQIVQAYNMFIPEQIDLSNGIEQEKSYYKVGSYNYIKGFISELKRLNPDVEISGKWISKNNSREQFTIITSKPIEELNQPTGYYGDSLGRMVFPESYDEFKQSIKGDFLDYSVSDTISNGFADVLRKLNPNVEISMTYDKDKNAGKIISSIPYDKLKILIGYYGIGLDKDGSIAFLRDKIIDYKIDYELDGKDNSKKYCEVTQTYFGSISRKQEQEKNNQGYETNESEKAIRDDQSTQQLITDKSPDFEPSKDDMTQNNLQTVKYNSQDELARMAREKRKFTILQRERAKNDAQKSKNRSAIMAGICILGVAVAIYFNGQDVNQVLQHELSSIYSWEALGQYFQDLGPATTLLSAGAGGFIAKYLKNSKKLKQAQNEIIDFNSSLENEQTLGGNENVKSM